MTEKLKSALENFEFIIVDAAFVGSEMEVGEETVTIKPPNPEYKYLTVLPIGEDDLEFPLVSKDLDQWFLTMGVIKDGKPYPCIEAIALFNETKADPEKMKKDFDKLPEECKGFLAKKAAKWLPGSSFKVRTTFNLKDEKHEDTKSN